jgi:hypothetical protein
MCCETGYERVEISDKEGRVFSAKSPDLGKSA